MMIGPAPMMRMRWMSLRLGIFVFLHHRREAIEQGGDVMRAGRGFGVALEAEGRAVGAGEALQRAVKQRDVGDAAVVRQAGGVDCEAVVLRGNQDLPRVEV